MKSAVIKRSVLVSGHKTSVSLEDIFWQALKELAVKKNIALCDMVDEIDKARTSANLSSALRQHVMEHFYDMATRKPALAANEVRPALAMYPQN